MRRGLYSLIIIAVLAAVWVLIAPWLATRLIVERPLEKADAIIVLSGSYVYKERTRKAAELYDRGVAPRILITNDGERGGWSQKEQTNIPYVELEQRELISAGVPAEAITVLTGLVTGTDEEAKELAQNLDTYSIKSVVVVTSVYHSRRALWTFDRILADKTVTIGIEHAGMTDRTPNPNYWWLKPRGWQMVAGEYVKWVVYYAYY